MKEIKTVDITPTWEAIVPVLVLILQGSNPESAVQELKRMARLADLYVASVRQKEVSR